MFAGGGGLGLVALVAMLALGVFSRDAFDYRSPFERFPQQPQGTQRRAVPQAQPQTDLLTFLEAVVGDIQQFWARTLPNYQRTTLRVFEGGVNTGCGPATEEVGPFYCPVDGRVYLDTDFFVELERRFQAPGDFAQAYVVAHEFGHHVQNITGVSGQVQQAQGANPEIANELSVALELQADCLAGVWAHSTYERGLLEEGDLQEGLRAAAAVGDDTVQSRTTGQINPETWTHGSAEQRQEWFTRGFESGDPNQCDAFEEELGA